jgi:hypothetical protein
MKVNFSYKFKSLKGDELPVTDGNPEHLGEAAANALLANDPADRDFKAKAVKYHLAMKLYGGGEIEVKPEEVVMIKAAMGSYYLPLVCGQAEAILDGSG